VRGVAVVLACFALIALLLAWSRWLAGRKLAMAGHVFLGVAAGWAALVLWSMTGSLVSYESVVPGQPVAELYLEQVGSRSYRGTLTRLPAGRVQVFELAGDQWRLEARTLEWQGRAARLGLDSMYRLERLSTRPQPGPDGEAGSDRPTSSHNALAADTSEDLWAKARTRPGWMLHLKGAHADGPWRPMIDGARFTVWLAGPGALRIEPANEAAAARDKPPG
jgi:hypothetical protein